ncbi:MAG: ABC transporter ATP-binding protein [Candidatus Latescibacterota bacterium]|jgi:putative ABC transport system ATP-binding protein|nr:MAG: ABC transporter ATP-binding protein [Candidatus Latescibacterota bacterium]
MNGSGAKSADRIAATAPGDVCPSITAERLVKTYRRGAESIHAVDNVSLTIAPGEFVSFIGPSGSGKTTLINILGCLDNPTSGRLDLCGQRIFDEGAALGEAKLTDIRREMFGYVFQKFYLIPTLTVRENVMLPFVFWKKPGAEREVDRILALLGIENRRDHLPGEISGGEMQRVAIARSLVNKPRILMADEPTGNLDVARSEEIAEILQDLNAKEGLTIVLVTHNMALAKKAGRIIELRDGRLHVPA